MVHIWRSYIKRFLFLQALVLYLKYNYYILYNKNVFDYFYDYFRYNLFSIYM